MGAVMPMDLGKCLDTIVRPKHVFCGMFRTLIITALFLSSLLACKSGEEVPDVSKLEATTALQRFDKDFFSMDTTKLPEELNRLRQRYPDFLDQYMGFVLGIDPRNPQALEAVRAFLESYQVVFTASNAVLEKHLPETEKQIQLGIKLMQHYFPTWKPEKPFAITTFVGPMDAYEPFAIGDYGDVRTPSGVGIAMQLHLGANAMVYEAGKQSGALYDYQTRRFTPEMMAVNAMKSIVEDAFPYNAAGQSLVEEMVEKGKRLYILKKLMPAVPDSLQLGYTGKQLQGCEANEALIWNFFVKNDLLYSKEPLVNQNYIKDGPKTQELGEGAPGYIGLFVGRKIVEAFMEKNRGTTLEALMKMPAKEIFEKAGYKP
jgi:hypothetical protein